jgi:hypothetical protein
MRSTVQSLLALGNKILKMLKMIVAVLVALLRIKLRLRAPHLRKAFPVEMRSST